MNYSAVKNSDQVDEVGKIDTRKPTSKTKKRPPLLDIQIGDISFDKIREKLTSKTTQEKKSIEFNPVRVPTGIHTSRGKLKSNLIDQIQA